jgi:hypothetical protein
VCVHAGRFDEAAALLEESDAISQATGAPPPLYIEPMLAAYRGQEARRCNSCAQACTAPPYAVKAS